MTKTLTIDDETHKIAVDKQKEIKKKYKVHINLNEVMAAAIRKGINNIEEEFGLNNKIKIEEEDEKMPGPGMSVGILGHPLEKILTKEAQKQEDME